MVERSKEFIRVTHDEGSVVLRPNEFSFSTEDVDEIMKKAIKSEYLFRILTNPRFHGSLKYTSKGNRDADFNQIWQIIKEINDNNAPNKNLSNDACHLVELPKTDKP